MKKGRIPFLLFTLLCLFPAARGGAQNIAATIKELSSLPSRLPGTPGHEAAAAMIEARFRAAGLRNVTREEFSSVVPVDKGAYVSVGSARIPLACVWPNLVRTSTVPPEGIAGRLVYARTGRLQEVDGKDIVGSIVLLDFDSGSRWADYAMLGARAAVFLDQPAMVRSEAERKFLDIPVDFPRFFAGPDATARLKALASSEPEARLFGRMDWEKVRDWNIYGYVPGTDPDLSHEIVILSAPYDSISAVPAAAPGAESSCGVAALLDTLDSLAASRPARTVLFLATSGHYENLNGATSFIQSHLRTIEPFSGAIRARGVVEPFRGAVARAVEKKLLKGKDAVVPPRILFVGLDISSGSDQLGIWHNSYAFYHQRFFAPIGKKFLSYAQSACSQLGRNPATALVNGISPEKGISWQTFLPDFIRTDGEMMILAGIPAVSLVTVNDGRWRIDTPRDTFDRVNLANVERQAALLKQLVRSAVNDPELFPDSELKIKDVMGTLSAKLVTFDPRRNFVPDKPVPGALVLPRRYYLTAGEVLPSLKTYTGVRGAVVGMTDDRGIADIDSLLVESNVPIYMSGFSLDPATGAVVRATDMGVNGNEQYPVSLKMDYKKKDWITVLFDCVPMNVYSLVDPQYLSPLNKLDILDTSNSTPDAYGYSLQYPDFIPWTWSSYCEPFGVVFARPGSVLKIIGESGPLGKRMLLLNSRESLTRKELVEGLGFKADETPSIAAVPWQAARDMIILDSFRRNNFERFGIRNERLQEMQDESTALLKLADGARERKKWFEFVKHARQSQAVESRAYPDVKSTANDVVKGIIFYFMLLLPFAYFAERLFFTFPKIEQRIAGVFGVFIAVYWVMRLVHPAFKLTNAPEVILLSFIVLSLSFIVISIVASKFESQMQRMKKESSKVYQTDVGRVTAAGTAFSLGVANMKRRKMRTILTSITLILLTFTVLSFTSIKSYMRFNQVLRSNTPSYQGVLLRDRSWAPMQEIALEYTEHEFSEDCVIAPRGWYVLREMGSRTAIAVTGSRGIYLANGLLGLAADEDRVTGISRTLTAGRWFAPGDVETCILPAKIADALGIGPADAGTAVVSVYGRPLTVVGILDAGRLNELRDLDDERLTPVDFSTLPEKEVAKMKMEKTAQVYSSQAKIQTFVHTEAENIVIVPYRTVMEMKGTLHSVAVRFSRLSSVKALVEGFVSKLAVIIFAGIGERTFVFSSMGLTSFSGIGTLIIPILIAAMIVLNTMLGSVYERIKEIGTYSAVGLAPVHIASLFLAESLVYAVLGGVAGYLLGQIVAKVLMATGALRGLVLNYSSLSAVISTIVIFITVLLSTIYPARKASQMAVPDVTRKWILPDPKGDDWAFEFPFTVSELEVVGLVTFLSEYFNSYQDVSLGSFYTNGATLTSTTAEAGKRTYTVDTEVWLAPFDLGVSQRMKVLLQPLGQYNFYTINVVLARTSGESTDWKRLNRRFLDGIRKQFLIWRTVGPETKKEYDDQGRAILKIA